MLTHRFLVFALLTALSCTSFAQEQETPSKYWVSDPQDVINMKVGYLSPALSMKTYVGNSNDESSSPVEFKPPPLSKIFIGANYRNLGATLSASTRQSSSDSDKYGSGTALDFQLNFYGRRLTQQYFYQTYDSYYISNTSVVDPAFPQDQFIKRPDIKTQHYGVNLIYNFNPENYSLSIAYDQGGWQLESGGAWLVALGLHNHRFSADPQLLPVNVSSNYGELATLQKGDIIQLNASGGFGYTQVFKKNWYGSFNLLLGPGFAYQQFETAEAYYKQSSFNMASAMTVSFGYNGKDNYVVLQGGSNTHTYKFPDLKMEIESLSSALYYGHRFGEMDVGFLNSISAWLD